MKNRTFVSRFAVVAALVVFSVQDAFAQLSGQSALTKMNTELKSLVSPLLNVLSLLVGVVGAVFVVINLIKYFKSSQQDSDNSLLKVGIGLVIAAVLLQVIKAVALS